MPYDPRDIRIEPRYADNQPFITIGQQEIPITRPQQRMIPIKPPEPDLPIWQVNEGDYDQLGYQTNLGDLQNLMDYTTTAPAKGALMGIAKNDGVLNQLYGGLKGLLKSYTKHPKEAPSGKAIAKEFGLDNETFRSKAFGGNIDPELYPNISPADIGGFGIDISADLTNFTPFGAMFAGAKAKGFKKAGRKFSGLWDKKQRFEIPDDAMKLKKDSGNLYYGEMDFHKYEKLKKENPKDYRALSRYDNINYHAMSNKQRDRYHALREKHGFDIGEDHLGSVIDHPELFENYPELKNKRVEFSDLGEGTRGTYGSAWGDFEINKSLRNDPEQLKQTLSHEMQHYIQGKEGFARGGSPEMFYADLRTRKEMAMSELKELNAEMSSLSKKMDKMKELGYDAPYKKDTPGYKALKRLEDKYVNVMGRKGDLSNDFQMNIGDEAFEQYKKLGGEAESRDVSDRLKFTDKQRMETQPLESTGYRLQDLIIR